MSHPIQNLTLPTGVTFADLKFRVDGTDYLHELKPFRTFCRHNRIAMSLLTTQMRCDLINDWYDLHVAAGQARDPVMENLRAEIAAEIRAQGGVQLDPGHA